MKELTSHKRNSMLNDGIFSCIHRYLMKQRENRKESIYILASKLHIRV